MLYLVSEYIGDLPSLRYKSFILGWGDSKLGGLAMN